jgi:uncharacterized membrane protein YjfL (UPF0719 family)
MNEYFKSKVTIMKNKLIDKYDKFEAKESHFNTAFVIGTVALISYLTMFTRVDIDTIISMGTGIVFNVVILLLVGFGLQKFQLGTKRDIQKEIFDDHNIAAAIYQMGIWLALALVISKGLM